MIVTTNDMMKMGTASALTTKIRTHRMNIVKLKIKRKDIHEVRQVLNQSKVKYYPFEKTWGGYYVRFNEHPIASFLAIKYAVDDNHNL